MRIWFFGDDVDTDAIMPAQYLNNNDPSFYSKHCLEQVNERFAPEAKAGDVIVAGDFFGCGSSRESAPYALKYLGIKCVFAKSFSRIFFRNSINIGLPVITLTDELEALLHSAEAVEFLNDYSGFSIEVNGKRFEFPSNYPPFIQEILRNGGLLAKYRKNQ